MSQKDWPGSVVSKTPVTPSGSYVSSTASGIWSMNDVAYWIKQQQWPGLIPADPYYEYVSLLLTGNGTNGAQNNTFLDSSTNNFTITRAGNTTQGTFSPYGSLWSNYFDGNGDSLTFGTTSSFNFMHNTSGLFTFECWVYRTVSTGAEQWLFDNEGAGTSSSVGTGIWLNNDGTVVLGIYRGVNGTSCVGAASTTATTLNSWNHVAITWDYSAASNNCKFYINGVFSNAVSRGNTASNSNATYAPVIGKSNDATYTYYYNGYISNMRITNSIVYTSNFTPSTTPLTAVSGTSLLTCQSNRFIDNSSNNFTLTVNGNTSVQRFSPFNPTAPYSAATIGGSGYFDGTGDYLNTPATGQFAPTGDFTVGVWYYPLALPTYSEIVGNYTASTSVNWIIEAASTGQLNFYTNGASIRIQSAAGAIKIGQWHYIALCRSGTTLTGYLNGTSLGTYTQSGTFGSATKAIYIGSQNGSYLMNGYLSDVKLIDGSAITTVPTAPMTATTGTNLLLNFTNAGIPDAAMMNDLETVGNAQVSTSVKKYGTGSLYFDGNGDWVTAPNSPNFAFDSGNFTIEMWVYLPSLSSANGLISKRQDTNTGYKWIVAQVNSSSGTIRTTVATSNSGWAIDANTTNAISANTWTHVAWVRNGSDFSVYVAGNKNTLTSSFTGSIYVDTESLVIGAAGTSGSYTWPLNGYIDDLRITKGYARYTANFTPPTAALPTY